MNHTRVTLIGNLTTDPEMRYTASGAPVANFTIASTPRTFDRNSGQWRDGDTLFMRCSLWQQAAENVAETLQKGMRVVAYGRLVQRRFQTQDGQDRSVVEMQVEDIGPSMRYATAQVTRNPRRDGVQQAGTQGGSVYGASEETAHIDPWATGSDSQETQPAFDNEPPF